MALRALETVSAPDASWAKWYEQIEAFVHNGRAFALAGLGKNGAAMAEFEASIRLSPENAWVYHNRGQVCELAGDQENAIADYQKEESGLNFQTQSTRAGTYPRAIQSLLTLHVLRTVCSEELGTWRQSP